MNSLAAIRRLALVLGLFAGVAGLHASLASVGGEAAAAPVAEAARPAPPASGHASLGGCGEDSCQVEYCQAPASSEMAGYAIPCPAGRAG